MKYSNIHKSIKFTVSTGTSTSLDFDSFDFDTFAVHITLYITCMVNSLDTSEMALSLIYYKTKLTFLIFFFTFSAFIVLSNPSSLL